MVAAYCEYIFVLPIMSYALLVELFNYAKSMMMCKDEITDEKAEHDHMKQITIPIVRERSIWLFCKALNMEAELAIDLDAKNDNIEQTPVPNVRNPAVFSICKKLGLKAKLQFPKNYAMAKPNDIPTVFIKDVYLLCRALKIKAQMHP
ncbi:hypothetical protein AVEN_41435-1 [Araneus ventricosus]|uniref:Uncharacterized protein n=1 Tax=Araneus ventricosus TaxID=182803 RepID=A0A4Y2XAA4_ARAVE|nr:hypothetical protein AVEN_29909-1 [Araneus ventricosus]GBO45905.1 hypothetical protein AVEN_41435-1 [Araneus ventricosus]